MTSRPLIRLSALSSAHLLDPHDVSSVAAKIDARPKLIKQPRRVAGTMWLQPRRIRLKAHRPGAANFVVQSAQTVCIVHVVPFGQQMHVEFDPTGAFERLCSDALGTPGYVVENAAVSLLQAEQIVAAIA